jgi:hypothetical protein
MDFVTVIPPANAINLLLHSPVERAPRFGMSVCISGSVLGSSLDRENIVDANDHFREISSKGPTAQRAV